MDGSFTSGRFRFNVERSDWATDQERGFREDLTDDDFVLRLTGSGKVPDLGGAPVASWLLARLGRLTGDRLGLAGVADVDGGGYMVEFVVYRIPARPEDRKATFMEPLLFNMDEVYVNIEPERPVASFQFQAGMEGTAVIGRRAADCPAEAVLDALASALLVAPSELSPRELVVRDPEWKLDPEMYRPRPVKGSRNWYGWDGSRFLGEDNIR
jgi:hypothetical protein